MSYRRRVTRAVLAVVVAAAAVTATPAVAVAVPPPPNPSDEDLEASRDEVFGAARRVGVLTNKVVAASAELDAAQTELAATLETASAAKRDLHAARAAAEAARSAAERAAAESAAAAARIDRTQRQADEFVAASFRQGSVVGSITAFVGSDNPADLLARAELLDAVGGDRLNALESMQRARVQKANTDSAARAALEEARARQQAAATAKAVAEDTYRAAAAADQAAERRSVELLARKADLESRLADVKGALYELENQRDRYEEWQAAKEAAATAHAAAEAQAAAAQQGATGQAQQVAPQPAPQPAPDPGGVLAPTTGVITSTYGARWGTIHYGLDIANDIGTPIVSVMDGEVISSGPASGFGLWVRVRHPGGTMTVYGHIHESLVSVGEWVVAGEQIATMGSRGQSTGPHLHFEVHRNGSKIAPLVWLRGQGVRI